MRRLKNFSAQITNALAQKQDAVARYPAVLGDGRGNLHLDARRIHVYARVAGFVVVAVNKRVPAENDLKVWLGYSEEENIYEVLDTRSSLPGGLDTGRLGGYAPADRYRWMAPHGGQDPLYVELRAITPLRVGVSAVGGVNVDVNKGWILNGNEYIHVPSETLSLASHVPTTVDKAAFVLVTVDTSGDLILTKGDEVDEAALAATDIPSAPEGTNTRLAAVRVYNGQTAIQEARTNTDIIDLRLAGMGSLSGVNWNDILNIPSVFPPDVSVTNPLYANVHLKTSDPTAFDDVGLGYRRLALWLNTITLDWFVCVSNANDAAVWVKPGEGGGGSGGGGSVGFKVPGALSVADDVAPSIIITAETSITEWYFYLKDTGSAGSTILDIILNGTDSILQDVYDDNRPEIEWDDADGWVKVTALVTDFVEGDILTLNIDQVATDSADLTVTSELVNTGLTVEDESATVTISQVKKIVVPDGKVTDDGGGQVTLDISGGGSGDVPPALLVYLAERFE